MKMFINKSKVLFLAAIIFNTTITMENYNPARTNADKFLIQAYENLLLTNAKLNDKNVEFESSLKQKQDQLKSSEQSKKNLNDEILTLQFLLTEQKKTIGIYQTGNKDLNIEFENVKKLLQKNADKYEKKVNKYKTIKKDQKRQIENLTEERIKFSDQCKLQQEKIFTLKQEIQKLYQLDQKKEQEIQQLLQSAKKKAQEIKDWSIWNQQCEDRISTLNGKIFGLENTIKYMQNLNKK